MRRLAVVAGIAIGVAAMTSGCATGSSSSGASPQDTAFYGGTILVTAQGGQSTLPLSRIEEIKNVAGVKTAFPTYRFDAQTGVVEKAGIVTSDEIVASDPTEAAWSSLKTAYAQGHAIDADSSGEVVLGSAIAQQLKKAVGDTIDLPISPSGGASSHEFKVIGVLDATHTGPDRIANINITDGQMLLKDSMPAAQRDQIDVTTVATAIDVYANSGTSVTDLDKIADEINKQVVGVTAIKPSELVAGVKQ
ncbi:MAG TPA: ABC transporter permease [Candidatus Dormibacteraeota bacterium]|nr:ABC transporter permease [Candidatus Dormibacteraeota bacterium]